MTEPITGRKTISEIIVCTNTWCIRPFVEPGTKFSVDVEVWRTNGEGEFEYKTHDDVSPKQFDRLIKLLDENKWDVDANRSDVVSYKNGSTSVQLNFRNPTL